MGVSHYTPPITSRRRSAFRLAVGFGAMAKSRREPAALASDPLIRLEHLGELKDKGLMTEIEYEKGPSQNRERIDWRLRPRSHVPFLNRTCISDSSERPRSHQPLSRVRGESRL